MPDPAGFDTGPQPYRPTARQYLRVYRAAAATSLAREMEYRGNFVLLGLSNLAWMCLLLAVVLILFGNVRAIAGWNLDQMLVLTGTYQLVTGVTFLLFETNMGKLSEQVNKGELDYVLLKPIDAQFLVSTRFLNVAQLPPTVAALVTLGVGWARLGLRPGPLELLTFLVLLICAVVASYALWFTSVTLTLWTGRIENIQFLVMPVMEMARVPADVFRGLFYAVFTFAIPIALAATLPSKALLGLLDPWMALYAILLAALLLWVSHRFWRYSLSKYTSASS
jgi:ABC-2 type transport system permease protein